jgi:putative PEP-CTERM system histidine kinase
MVALGLDSIFTGLSLRNTQLGGAIDWLTPAFVAKSFVPAVWLCFSLTYSRSQYREFLVRWKAAIMLLGLLALTILVLSVEPTIAGKARDGFWWLQAGVTAKTLNAIFITALALILANLEQTFRSAVGTMRWRIKGVVLALAVIFGARLYVQSQAILFSEPDIALWTIESGALLVGCLFLALAYMRTGLGEIDVHPSTAVLRSSFTVLAVGSYLFVVGVLAQLVTRFGGAELFQLQAVVVLLGLAGLAVLLLSDRFRQTLYAFVVRHFRKAQHDSVRIWTLFSQRLASISDQAGLCAIAAKLVSENFNVLSVTVWLLDEERGRFVAYASTAGQPLEADDSTALIISSTAETALNERPLPFDLEDSKGSWAEDLRTLNPSTFINGGHRVCVPMREGQRTVGLLVLADRVNAAAYTVEELALLKCIADQMTSFLLNLRLGSELSRARELEAFRTMSAFFVHDLKNTAASLNLMLKNLPVHFDDPEFRQDTLRGIGNTARRIDEMIARLSTLRQRPDGVRVKADLNQLVSEALERVNGTSNVELTKELHPIPPILADRDQIQSVVTNLVVNAKEALGAEGQIRVRTESQGARVVLSVTDNGCGMSPAFMKELLFRPFQSTKKKGLGIGLFQARAIVHAHGGGMKVESETGKGTTFLVTLPAMDTK